MAEDNPVNQLLACHVTVAEDGKEAVAAHERDSFDLILMDGQMHTMDGFEAMAIIRDREETTGGYIPIVALTAHAMKGDRERSLGAGMDAYLAKPFTPDQLVDVINQLVS